ncbi:MAG: bifunctional 4-hydroxy-2-oxoglutarate aldolase/2-dehydro-3-deoxy-phosphogluconate aldolase [Chloroflexota bacterium]|nr:bifunctional 4-hydroxy-2-oxoglutarate aldolase/2-dehydro-3-deoxy-phosphogluconate aldolase [Chloroflexota bacterium]
MVSVVERTPKAALVERMTEAGIIAIMRHTAPALARQTVDALSAGGVQVIEVTMNSAGASDMLRELADAYRDDVLLGAGTVLTAASAEQALCAGARFIVAPNTDRHVIEYCNRRDVPVVPGALTPTEVVTAWQQGADLVKIFPAGGLGPRYLRDLGGPLGDIPFVPTGGVSLDNAADFMRAGAAALGVGSDLVHRDLVDQRDFATITARAKDFVAAVAAGRR